ncbi:hypothetical protein MRX96_034149 [Rhipicephalus microplus]
MSVAGPRRGGASRHRSRRRNGTTSLYFRLFANFSARRLPFLPPAESRSRDGTAGKEKGCGWDDPEAHRLLGRIGRLAQTARKRALLSPCGGVSGDVCQAPTDLLRGYRGRRR